MIRSFLLSGFRGSRTPLNPSVCSGAGMPRPKKTLNARTGTSFGAAARALERTISSSNGNPIVTPPTPLSRVRRLIRVCFIDLPPSGRSGLLGWFLQDQITRRDGGDQIGVGAALFLGGLMDGFDLVRVRCPEWAAERELSEFPGDGLADAIATGKQVHQFGGRLIGHGFRRAREKDVAILSQLVSVSIFFPKHTQPIEPFEAERERFESHVATLARLIGDSLFGDSPLRQARLGGDRCCVHSRRRIFHNSPEQVMKHEQPPSHHGRVVATDRQDAALRQQSSATGNGRQVVASQPGAVRLQPIMLGQSRSRKCELCIK